MRIIKRLLFTLVVLSIVFCSGQVALALIGSQAGDDASFTVYPNAPGTKYEGPLTLYFTNKVEYIALSEGDHCVDAGSNCDLYIENCEPENYVCNQEQECEWVPPECKPRECEVFNDVCLEKKVTNEMYIFLRLKKGMSGWAFSGIASDVSVTQVGQQQAAVEDFVAGTVVPLIYGCTPGNCPPALLKSADKVAADDPSLSIEYGEIMINCCDAGSFWILDVVIAVQD